MPGERPNLNVNQYLTSGPERSPAAVATAMQMTPQERTHQARREALNTLEDLDRHMLLTLEQAKDRNRSKEDREGSLLFASNVWAAAVNIDDQIFKEAQPRTRDWGGIIKDVDDQLDREYGRKTDAGQKRDDAADKQVPDSNSPT